MNKNQAEEMKKGAYRVSARRGVASRFNRRRFSLDMGLYPEGKDRYVKVADLPMPPIPSNQNEAANVEYPRVFIVGGMFLSNRGKLENKHTGDNTSASIAVTGFFDEDGNEDTITPYYRFVNVPSHIVPQIQDIINDPEAVEAINKGAFAFRVYSYMERNFNRRCYSLNFVDVNVE